MSTSHDRAVAQIYREQYRALMRMQLYALGETHAIIGAAGREIAAVVAGRREGEVFGPTEMVRARPAVDKLWSAAHQRYATLLYASIEQAAKIAFGGLARMHVLYIGHGADEVGESRQLAEAAPASTFVFDPQLRQMLDAAERRVVGGLRLSDRVWKLNQESRRGIEQALMNAITNGKSAWDAAKDVEQFLGAGADCPRWTRTRLRLTKKEIAAGDRRGLKTGDECVGQGVSYNALRLMRTEIQAVHNATTQDLMKAQPWVKEEQMFLSPAHPVTDICDDVIAQGRGGQGIYPKGTLRLPIHPNCLCGLRAVVEQSPTEFTSQLRGWMRGESSWPEMDTYANNFGRVLGIPGMFGGALAADVLAGVGESLLRWLTELPNALDDLMSAAGYETSGGGT